MPSRRKEQILLRFFRIFLFAFALASFSVPVWARDPVDQLIHWTNENNPGLKQSTKPFPVEYYEVPLRLMDARLSGALSPKIRDSLIYEKNGERYVRFLKHPTDDYWTWSVVQLLQREGLPSAPVTGTLRGWNNASRSVYVEDPAIGYVFELKGSTKKAPGPWKDKPLFAGAVAEMADRDDFVQKYAPRAHLRHTEITFEPASFVFKNQDVTKGGSSLGMIARDLGLQRHGKTFLLPGYAALDSDLGKQIALLNGSTDPAKFWEDHYIRPLARSTAELKTELGIEITSAHSQNFYVVLDEHLRPTGKIRHKDFTDGDLHLSLLEARGLEFKGHGRGQETAGRNGKIVVESSVLSGGRNPSWNFAFSGQESHSWNKAFIDEFETEMAKITGVPKAEWASARTFVAPQAGSQMKYMNYYPEASGPWQQFLKNIREGKLPKLPAVAASAGMESTAAGAHLTEELAEARAALGNFSLPASQEKLCQLYRMDPEAVIRALLEQKLKGELTPQMEAALQRLVKLPTNQERSPVQSRGLWELGSRDRQTLVQQLNFLDEYSVAREAFEYAAEHKIRDPELLEKSIKILTMVDRVHLPEDAAQYLVAISPLGDETLLGILREARKLDRAPIYLGKILSANPLTPALRAELVHDLINYTPVRNDALTILRKVPEAKPQLISVVNTPHATVEQKAAALDLLTELRITEDEAHSIQAALLEIQRMPRADSGKAYLLQAHARQILESHLGHLDCAHGFESVGRK